MPEEKPRVAMFAVPAHPAAAVPRTEFVPVSAIVVDEPVYPEFNAVFSPKMDWDDVPAVVNENDAPTAAAVSVDGNVPLTPIKFDAADAPLATANVATVVPFTHDPVDVVPLANGPVYVPVQLLGKVKLPVHEKLPDVSA